MNEQKKNHRNYEHYFNGTHTCFGLDRDQYHVFRKHAVHMGKQRDI